MRTMRRSLSSGIGAAAALILSAGTCSAQEIYAHIFGGAGDQGGISAIAAADSGYAVVGLGDSLGTGGQDCVILKLDPGGSVVWARAICGPEVDWGTSVAQTTDGGFVVAGITYVAGLEDILLVKFSSSGSWEWSRSLGGTNHDMGWSVVATADGGCVVVGETSSFSRGDFGDLFIVKFSASGWVEWARTVGGYWPDWGSDVIQTRDGGYAVAGCTVNFGAGTNDMFLVKFTSSGSIEWASTAGGADVDVAKAVAETADGGLIVAGTTESFGAGSSTDCLLARFSSLGSLEWATVAGGATGNDFWRSVVESADGGCVVAGTTGSYGAGGLDCFVAQFDASGSLDWASVLGGTDTDEGFSVIRNVAGNYAMTGGTWNFGARARDLLFAVFDEDGYNCRSVAAAITSAPVPDIASGPAPVAAVPVVLTPAIPSLVVTPIDPQTTRLCSNSGFDGPAPSRLPGSPVLHLSPNPFSVACAVSICGVQPGGADPAAVQVLDAVGRRIWETAGAEALTGPGSPPCGLSGGWERVWRPDPSLPGGVYFVRARTADGWTATQRVVRVR